MAELYQAYGAFNDEEDEQPRQQQRESAPVYSPNIPIQTPQQAPQPQVQQSPEKFSNHNTREHFTQEYVHVPNQNQQAQQVQQAQQYKRNTSYSFWDRMAIKRTEVIKLAIFALVIVLAIAIDRIGTHYLTKYLSDNIFTEFQEFMLRLSYPVVIFLVLWIVKAL